MHGGLHFNTLHAYLAIDLLQSPQLTILRFQFLLTQNVFNEHMVITCKKAVLAFLRRNFKTCQRKIKTDLYIAYVKPILDYSVSVWAPHINPVIDQLDSIH